MSEHAIRHDGVAEEVASRLVAARRDGMALERFPGAQPDTLEAAYAIQDAAIRMWDDQIVGWKIGLVPVDLRQKLGADRLVGPIFSRDLRSGGGAASVPFPVFVGGFAAIEAEFVLMLGDDPPAQRTRWTLDEAAAMVASCHVGAETAGSPMAMINELGPTAVASDFGNNAGLIVGPAIREWRDRLDELVASVEIEGRRVGEGGAFSIPGGPLEGLRFLLQHLALRGRTLGAGQYVSSGAVTGVHDISAGQSARLAFAADGVISCHEVAKA
jgi:2-keto-4-pentenoate hydratase